MKIFSSKNKRGVTLVEVVFGTVILAFFATGVLSLLISANNSIDDNYERAFAVSAANQKLDTAITLLSGGTEAGYVTSSDNDGDGFKEFEIEVEKLLTRLELEEDSISFEEDFYVISATENKTVLRGWKITLSYGDVTVKGYASNTQGAFNYDDAEEE